VTLEQLGFAMLFVDESHNYKNLFLYTIRVILDDILNAKEHLPPNII